MTCMVGRGLSWVHLWVMGGGLLSGPLEGGWLPHRAGPSLPGQGPGLTSTSSLKVALLGSSSFMTQGHPGSSF